MTTSIFNVTRIIRAVRCSSHGVIWLLHNEAAFRQEFALFVALFVASCLLGFDLTAHAIQISLMSLILLVEALNTAIEKLVDRISLDRHPLSGLIKDIGSVAVALSFIPLASFWIGSLLA